MEQVVNLLVIAMAVLAMLETPIVLFTTGNVIEILV